MLCLVLKGLDRARRVRTRRDFGWLSGAIQPYFSTCFAPAVLMNPLIFQRPEFGRFFSLRSGNNRTKRTNWHPAALLTTIAFVHSHAAGLAQRASIS